jgi:outer membrane receptor protein involved in Fe transport
MRSRGAFVMGVIGTTWLAASAQFARAQGDPAVETGAAEPSPADVAAPAPAQPEGVSGTTGANGSPTPLGAAPPDTDLSRIAALPLEVLLDQKVETATKTSTGILRIPNRVVVVTDQDIRRRGYRYLIELVEDLPGIQVMNMVEAETGAHVIVRGIWQNNKILVLYNGHKITSPEGKDFIFGRHNWSLFNVKRVEFIYGPASALYGADAVSAVINIVPKDEHDLGGHKIEATAGYGIDNTIEADVATGFGVGPLAVRLDAAFHKSDGPDFLARYPNYYATLREPKYRQQGGQLTANGDPVWVAPSLSYHLAGLANLGEHTRLQYLRIYSEEQSAMGFQPPLFEFSPENKWAWSQDNVGLTHELQLTEGIVSRSLVTYNHQQCDPKTQFINNFFDNGTSYTRADYKMFRSIRFGATQELVYRSPERHLQLVVGARFEDIYSLSKISTVTGKPALLRYPLNYQTNAAIPNGEVNFQAFGGYAQLQYDLTSNLNVVAGANVDKVWHYSPAVNPRVGLTYTAQPWLTLRASGAKAYLVPAPAYQFEGFNNKTFPGDGSVGAIPNTDLKPEDYRTYELGATAVLGHGQLLLDVSAFHTSNDNYLLRQRVLRPDAKVMYTPTIGDKEGLEVMNPQRIFTSENGGQVRAYGGEVSATADLFSRLRANASYSLALGSQHEQVVRTIGGIDSDYLANQAAHQVKGSAELRVLQGLFITPSLVWYSRTRLRNDVDEKALMDTGASGTKKSIAPFAIVNLSLLWDLGHFQIWARAQNLLNARYYRPGGPVSQQAAPRVPQLGLTGQVGLRVAY